MQIPPYGLKQRRHPQFRLPHRPCMHAPSILSRKIASVAAYIPESNAVPASQSSPKVEKICPISRPTSVQNFMPLAFSNAEKSVTVQTNKTTNKQVHQQACKTHTPPYGLSRGRRPQFRALVHATTDFTPCPPLNALVCRRHSSNHLQCRHTIQVGLRNLSAFFVPGDLDL